MDSEYGRKSRSDMQEHLELEERFHPLNVRRRPVILPYVAAAVVLVTVVLALLDMLIRWRMHV